MTAIQYYGSVRAIRVRQLTELCASSTYRGWEESLPALQGSAIPLRQLNTTVRTVRLTGTNYTSTEPHSRLTSIEPSKKEKGQTTAQYSPPL